MSAISQLKILTEKSNNSVIANEVFCNSLTVFQDVVVPGNLAVPGILFTNEIEPLAGPTILVGGELVTDNLTHTVAINNLLQGPTINATSSMTSPIVHTDSIVPSSGNVISIDGEITTNDSTHIVNVPNTLNVNNLIAAHFTPPPTPNIVCDTITVNNSADITGCTIVQGTAHSDQTLEFNQSLVSTGQFICVHDPLAAVSGMVFGPDRANTFSYLVNNGGDTTELNGFIFPNAQNLQTWNNVNGDSIIFGSLMAGSGTPTSGIGAGVIQIEQASAGGYGVPVSSAILYQDQIPFIKTPLATISLNNPPFINAFRTIVNPNSGVQVPLTMSIPTVYPDYYSFEGLSLNSSSQFTLDNITNTITYIEVGTRKAKVDMKIVLAQATGGITATQYGFLCYKNATINGARLITAGTIVFESYSVATFAGLPISLGPSFMVDVTSGDRLTFAVSSMSQTGNLGYLNCSLTALTFSVGTD